MYIKILNCRSVQYIIQMDVGCQVDLVKRTKGKDRWTVNAGSQTEPEGNGWGQNDERKVQ